MKKTISFLLVFCLFAFSLFSTGCGSSSGGFKFLGAVVAIAVIAGSGGTAPAVFAANVRGAISAKKTKVKVYELDARADGLRGTPISNIAATFDDNKKLSCTTDRLEVGDYLFEVYNSDIVFLRAILHVDGTSNHLTLDISPETEIKTAVYKEWLDKDPADTSVKNFELNLTAALEETAALKTAMTTKAVTYAENLATWALDQTTDIETVLVSDIDVPTATRPAYFQSATWTTITADDIVRKQFVMRYILDTDTDTWIKFTNEGTDTDKLPNIMFTPAEYYYGLGSGYYNMVEHGYTEETMDAWEPNENNEFEITQNFWDELPNSIYKVLSDSKIEVIDLDEEEEFIYDARITDYNGKTYLHIRDKNDQEIYELMHSQPQQPHQPHGSVR